MRFTPWATRLVLTLSLSATAFLTACGGGGGDGDSNTKVRLLNATRSYNSLDLEVNDKKVNTALAYASVGEYATVDTNATATKVTANPVGHCTPDRLRRRRQRRQQHPSAPAECHALLQLA